MKDWRMGGDNLAIGSIAFKEETGAKLWKSPAVSPHLASKARQLKIRRGV
jgi:hypothetical protein